MPLINFDFPGVTFRQEYAEASQGTDSPMSVLCVGTQYNLHKADSNNAVQVPDYEDYDASSGLTATVESAIGATIDDTPSTHHLVVKEGAYLYNTVASAGIDTANVDLANRIITFLEAVKDGNGYEAGANFGSRGAKVGDPVILTGSDGNDTITVNTTILKISNVSGKGYAQIVVGTVGALTTLTSVGFCEYKDVTYEEDASTFALSNATEDNLVIEGGLTTLLDDITAETTGTLQFGKLYIEYREALKQYVGKLGVVSSFNDIQEQLGPWCADNPLSLACYFALAGGSTTYFTGVSEETDDAYVTALDSLSNYLELYSVVPATEERSIIEACMTYCDSVSSDDENVIRRALWYGITADKEIKLWSGKGTFTGTTTITVTLDSDAYVDEFLQDGDKLRMTASPYTEWTIQGVTGTTVLTLASGSTAPSTTSNVSLKIVRTKPITADIVKNLAGKRCTQSERAVCVWADGLQFGGEDLPNYPLAAAAAGMRASEWCHRPLSNLGYSFFSLANSHGFTRDQLKLIGRNGIWIIANNQDGTPINMKQITTAVANDINKDEESIMANVDNIAMGVSRVGRDRVGNSNITPTLIDALEDELTAHMDGYLVNKSGSVYIGPQLIGWELDRIWQDPVNLDHVYASFWCQPPKPFNKFHITMRVI